MWKNLVIVSGKDCDGYFTPNVYEFKTEEEAYDFCNSCNEGSDGLIYENVDYNRAIEYLETYDLNFKNYINGKSIF